MPVTVYSIRDSSPIDLRLLPGITLLVTLPAAFSPPCTTVCVPGLQKLAKGLHRAGVDLIVFVSVDQPFALQEWVRSGKWESAEVEFASDFGSFEVRRLIGRLSDEAGKETLAPILGGLLRRSYSLVTGGQIIWQYVEKDSTKFTLPVEELLAAIAKAKS